MNRQEALDAPERALSILKGQQIEAAHAALRKKPDAKLPPILQGRLDKGEALPELELHGKLTREREEDEDETSAVLRYLVCDMKPELVFDLATIYALPSWFVRHL